MNTLAAVMNPAAAMALRAMTIHALGAPVRVGKSGIIAPSVPGRGAPVKSAVSWIVS